MTLKHLAVIGSNGMLGSDLVRYLQTAFRVTSIDKSHYDFYKGRSFDIIINANGNSRRFWANEHPLEDFVASTFSVYQSITDFLCDLYVYISSPDVYEHHHSPKETKEENLPDPKNLDTYGLHKYLSECIVKKQKKSFLVLRCSMILGSNLKKGPLYDVMHNKPLFISKKSRLQFITTHAISEIIEILVKRGITNRVINVGGIGSFALENLQKYFNKKIRYSTSAQTQFYQMTMMQLRSIYPTLKTSEEYLREFLRKTPSL